MQDKIKEINDKVKIIEYGNIPTLFKIYPSLSYVMDDIKFLLAALQEAQSKNNEMLMTFFDKQQELQRSQARERELHDIMDYKDSRIIDLEQAEERERVLREVLVTTCGAVEDLMAIGSEYGTSGYQVIVDEAREALKQGDKHNGNQ